MKLYRGMVTVKGASGDVEAFADLTLETSDGLGGIISELPEAPTAGEVLILVLGDGRRAQGTITGRATRHDSGWRAGVEVVAT